MTTTVKAKCPGCGDEDGEEARRFNSIEWDDSNTTITWRCDECKGFFKISDWLKEPPPRTLTDADIKAIASRVVEMMKS